ncbi:hypothetical protein CsatB_011080 [Cannabis sativa]
MGSRYFLLLALLLAFVALLISSDVAATDLAQTSTQQNKVVDANVKGVEDGKYGGYPGQGSYNNGGGQGSYDNGGGPYSNGGGRGRRGRRGGGGRCYYGCCRSNYYGRGCARCCSYAGEAVEAKPNN